MTVVVGRDFNLIIIAAISGDGRTFDTCGGAIKNLGTGYG